MKRISALFQKGGILLLAYCTTVTIFAHMLFSQKYPDISMDFFWSAQTALDVGSKILFGVIMLGTAFVYGKYFASLEKRKFVVPSFLLALVLVPAQMIGFCQNVSNNRMFFIQRGQGVRLFMTAAALAFCYCLIELLNYALDRGENKDTIMQSAGFSKQRFFGSRCCSFLHGCRMLS